VASALTTLSRIDKISHLGYSVQAQDADFPLKGEPQTMRERQSELRRRRKRKEEMLKAKRKASKLEAAAKKGK